MNDTLALFAPPRWLMFSVAALLAAALLAALVDTMQDNIRRGEALREGQRVSHVRQTLSTGADAAAATQPRQLRQANAFTPQRQGALEDTTKVARYD
ncbi:hypothetical protein [Roseateles sp.]|uniref:hypothetical protein n=1 Tax=Roseateles sp. TaxID=1971397 RepID=UPI003BA9DA0D